MCLYDLKIFPKTNRSATEGNHWCRLGNEIPKRVAFYFPEFVFTLILKNLSNGFALLFFYHAVQIKERAMQNFCQLFSESAFATSHEAGEKNMSVRNIQ